MHRKVRPGQETIYGRKSLAAAASLAYHTQQMTNVLDGVGVEVCYCSIYEDQCRSVYVGTREAAGAREGAVDECVKRD